MRVLHLPHNIASLISNSVRCLNAAGVEAKGIAYTKHVVTTNDHVLVLGDYYFDGLIKKRFKQMVYSGIFHHYFRWADVVHYYWNADVLPFELEFKFLQWYNKPAVIEWLGSDIRIPEVEFADNPYYERIMNAHKVKGDFSTFSNSKMMQEKFSKHHFKVITSPGMDRYLMPEYFQPPYYYLRQRIFLDELNAVYPDAGNNEPLIVHASTSSIMKGSQYITEAVEALKSQYLFQFAFVENMQRKEALKVMQSADIYVDQLNLGHHGLAAVEAMALGKPVICFIKPSLRADYPPDLPIVSANPDTIKTELERLIKNPQLRHELGKQGRAYVEKYHHPQVLANEMVKIYEDVIRRHRKK